VTDDLDALASAYDDYDQRVFPTFAHIQGEYRFADRFEDVSRAAEVRDIDEARDFARRAEAIPEAGLGAQDLITREMLIWDATARADLAAARLAEFGADPINGPQSMLPVAIPNLTLPSADVAEAMIGKYHGIATMYRDLADRHREGLGHGRTPATFAVSGTVEQLDAWLAGSPADDPLLDVAEPMGLADPDGWRAHLARIVDDEIRPAMAIYRDALRDEVLPHARPDERCGLSWLSDGAEAYASTIRFYTTVSMSPQAIHDVGLRQIESLAEEYRTLGPEAVGSGDLDTIFERMRSDPALHHTSGAEIVAASKTALAKATAAMGDWFGIVPKAGCEVEEVQTGGQAFYFAPAKDGSRGGVFFVNTADPSGWGRFDIESMAYHEGVPGHHLQLAISSELDGIPNFRKRAFVAAYDEGWGLYAERLADEMGLYSTPLDRMGMLSNDSLRACRLVVDTGLHAFGWSRRRAIDYMLEHSPMSEGHITAEVDRYAVVPGQALAYMLGRLEIQRIRAAAETALGDRFDIRTFHDAVLGAGPMPLPMLDRHVGDWIAATAAG
jgi:uncharacterized protein (DUF885 family)